MAHLQNGERIHLVDKKGRQYALTLKAGDSYQFSGQKIAHDDLIGRADGSVVTLSGGKKMLALRPTLGEYVLKMPRGAQVLYPKDLALIPMWADVYPGARVFEAGTGSGALTMALLRAVGPRGLVVTYEMREEFARAVYLDGYLDSVDQELVPFGSAFDKLLTVFELEKAVYELRYELSFRPDWVPIPVAGILRLLEQPVET